jgi:Zn-finger nucleic acid-binding protein
MGKECPECKVLLTKENHDFTCKESPLKTRVLTICECKKCGFVWIDEGEYREKDGEWHEYTEPSKEICPHD